MPNSSAENGDRPTLPSIWDLFGDELLESAGGYNPQAPSSPVQPGYATSGTAVGWINRQDHSLTLSDRGHGPLSAGENPPFIQQQVLDAAGPASYQPSPPQPYCYPPPDNQTFDETNPGAYFITFPRFPEDSSTTAKYECQHCGKAFNRPSTLRTHLHSHTGEKPFVCPVESCGRCFSVLSNMRRHARVHAQPTTREGTAQLSGEDTSSRDHQ